jgi:pyrimidine operon attenuation protein/uracil phosphoribosyltransferase
MSKKAPYDIPAHAQKILDERKINQKLQRIAYQILEQNEEAKELVFLGIEDSGLYLAKQIKDLVKERNPDLDINITALYINKENPLSEKIVLRKDIDVNYKNIILIDDVANTGKTMFYALQVLMQSLPEKVSVAVLIDRLHKKFPIAPDFVGFSLATTYTNHIIVDFDKDHKATGAYLF